MFRIIKFVNIGVSDSFNNFNSLTFRENQLHLIWGVQCEKT